jgi:hypothetical protein
MPRNVAPHTLPCGTAAPFAGFAAPTSNTTYAPNQFFDVCLPHSSRGVVRLVGYLIRKTLGWCDENGNPQTERHTVSYSELVQAAGISRDMIHSAVDDAIAGHFIVCSRKPQSKQAGKTGISGLYALKWDERGEYIKDPTQFRGFFAGEGNRTYIPNQFFDVLLPGESLAVQKVVGSVIRLSIGFQNKWGHRRRNVALSYQHIQNYSRLKDRTSLGAAIKHAIQSNYIQRVEEGFFDPDAGKLSKAAVYAVKWLNGAADETIGRKSLPAQSTVFDRSEKPTGIGQKTRPEDRSENQTGIEIKQTNKTLKQQQTPAATFEKLRLAGFDASAAQAIATRYSAGQIERQLQWIDSRKIKTNRLGMLRAAIEQDWKAPGQTNVPHRRREEDDPHTLRHPSGVGFAGALETAQQRLLGRSNPSKTS